MLSWLYANDFDTFSLHYGNTIKQALLGTTVADTTRFDEYGSVCIFLAVLVRSRVSEAAAFNHIR